MLSSHSTVYCTCNGCRCERSLFEYVADVVMWHTLLTGSGIAVGAKMNVWGQDGGWPVCVNKLERMETRAIVYVDGVRVCDTACT